MHADGHISDHVHLVCWKNYIFGDSKLVSLIHLSLAEPNHRFSGVNGDASIFFCNSSVAMPLAFCSFEFRFAYDGGRGGDIQLNRKFPDSLKNNTSVCRYDRNEVNIWVLRNVSVTKL